MRDLAGRARHRVPMLGRRPEVVARATADGRQVRVIRRRYGRLLLRRLLPGYDAADNTSVGRDDVTLQPDGRARRRRRLHLLLALVLRVHREEAQHQQVHGGRHDSQTEQDENEAEGDVIRPVLQVVLRLKRDEIAEPDRRERDETVIERVDVRPVLEVRERRGAAQQHETRHVHRDHDEVRLGHLEILHLQALLHRLQHERHEDVEALANALEHDEIERDADERVEHAEDLAADRARRAVAVACNGRTHERQVKAVEHRHMTYIVYSQT